MGNPFNVEFLEGLIGQQETQRLEFKSSLGLTDDPNKQTKFISEKLVPAVSALLNTDGGQLVVGIEEKRGVAVGISAGVPRSRITWEQLQSIICSRIQPAVAGHVSVYAIPFDVSSAEEKAFAFVIDVKPGTTSYQADDKKYYARRSGQNEAMEDKDIRLRMLAGDKPRILVTLRPQIVSNTGHLSQFVTHVAWMLHFENVGTRSIPRAVIRTRFRVDGLPESAQQMVMSRVKEYRLTDFTLPAIEASGLLPGQEFEVPFVEISSLAFSKCDNPSVATIDADVVAYVDDGLPFEITDYDLMADLRPVIENNWRLPTG